MPKMYIEKSTVIEAPVEKVYGVLSDFGQWQPWSPWLVTEPEAKVTVAEDGKSYEWEGKRTGSGKMIIMDESVNRSINIQLNFLKPWKSKAKVRFRIEPEGENTKVTWFMDSSLPFFMFMMVKMFTALIGMDYQRGLTMLKEYVERGSVTSTLEFIGESEFPGCPFVGLRTTCDMDKMGEQMMADFGKLNEFLDQNQGVGKELVFSIYHKWDPANGKVEYTGGCEVDQVPDNLPEGFISGNIPSTKIYTIRHIGSYQYLGNAWSTLFAMHKSKEIKPNKGVHPFEVYVSDPQKADEMDLITDIHFPIK